MTGSPSLKADLIAPRRLLRFEPPVRLGLAQTILSWAVCLLFLFWSARLVYLEGYLYEIEKGFVGDFTRTAELGAPTWWTGQGIFYGPIFVLEYRFLFAPQVLTGGDFARLDFVLFGIAFACLWLALIGMRRFRLAIFVLAAALGHHMSVEAFANTAHLEILELALMSMAILLAMRGYEGGAGASLGLAVATKTLPALFLPYLVLTRRWRMLAGAIALSGAIFLAVCWIQGITPWDGAYALIYQGGNLTKLEYTEYEYTPRAEIARMLAGDGGVVTPEQAQLAIALHWVIAVITMLTIAAVLAKARPRPRSYGLMFGLIAAAMLLVAPSAHAAYYIFLLPGWIAILAELLRRPMTLGTLGLWVALALAYTFTGFDQPFFLSQRLFGIGRTVAEHWLSWHLPTLGLLLSILAIAVLLVNARLTQTPPMRAGVAQTRP